MKSKNSIIEKKYKISILIDYFVLLLFLFISLIVTYFFTYERLYPSIICFFIVLPLYWFFGDKILKNKSIGKLIMGIIIIDKSSKCNATWTGVARRRYIEWKNYNSSLYRNKNIDIDDESGTEIVSKNFRYD